MRKVLLAFAFAALVAGCEAAPTAPDDSGPLQTADECTDMEGHPC